MSSSISPNEPYKILVEALQKGEYITYNEKEKNFRVLKSKNELKKAKKEGLITEAEKLIENINKLNIPPKEKASINQALKMRILRFRNRELQPKAFWARLFLYFKRRKIEKIVQSILQKTTINDKDLEKKAFEKHEIHRIWAAVTLGKILVFDTNSLSVKAIFQKDLDTDKTGRYLTDEKEIISEIFSNYELSYQDYQDLLKHAPKGQKEDLEKKFTFEIALDRAKSIEDYLKIAKDVIQIHTVKEIDKAKEKLSRIFQHIFQRFSSSETATDSLVLFYREKEKIFASLKELDISAASDQLKELFELIKKFPTLPSILEISSRGNERIFKITPPTHVDLNQLRLEPNADYLVLGIKLEGSSRSVGSLADSLQHYGVSEVLAALFLEGFKTILTVANSQPVEGLKIGTATPKFEIHMKNGKPILQVKANLPFFDSKGKLVSKENYLLVIDGLSGEASLTETIENQKE